MRYHFSWWKYPLHIMRYNPHNEVPPFLRYNPYNEVPPFVMRYQPCMMRYTPHNVMMRYNPHNEIPTSQWDYQCLQRYIIELPHLLLQLLNFVLTFKILYVLTKQLCLCGTGLWQQFFHSYFFCWVFSVFFCVFREILL